MLPFGLGVGELIILLGFLGVVGGALWGLGKLVLGPLTGVGTLRQRQDDLVARLAWLESEVEQLRRARQASVPPAHAPRSLYDAER